jgi:hypothetical protein
LLLHEKSKVAFIEFLKPVIPWDLLQRILPAVARKIEAYHADVITAASAPHAGRLSTPFFCPPANLVMIG